MSPSYMASLPGRYEIFGIDNHGPTQQGTCGIWSTWSRSPMLKIELAWLKPRFCFLSYDIFSHGSCSHYGNLNFYFAQQDSSAEYRRPGRPKGSRDRVPRKNNAKLAASIGPIDNCVGMEGSTALELCGDGRMLGCKDQEMVEKTSDRASYQESVNCRSTQPIPQKDSSHADWTYGEYMAEL